MAASRRIAVVERGEAILFFLATSVYACYACLRLSLCLLGLSLGLGIMCLRANVCECGELRECAYVSV